MIFVLERSKLEHHRKKINSERKTEERESKEQRPNSNFISYSNMTRRSVSLTTYGSTEAPLYYDGKMELRKCEDMSKNGDKMIPPFLAYIFWEVPEEPKK